MNSSSNLAIPQNIKTNLHLVSYILSYLTLLEIDRINIWSSPNYQTTQYWNQVCNMAFQHQSSPQLWHYILHRRQTHIFHLLIFYTMNTDQRAIPVRLCTKLPSNINNNPYLVAEIISFLPLYKIEHIHEGGFISGRWNYICSVAIHNQLCPKH